MKDPKLKLKYSEGLGDIIACFLHSNWFGWLTKIITGKDKPCKTCSERIYAFNVLVPIPLWRIFFKTDKDFIKKLKEEYALYYNTINIDKKTNIETKIEIIKPLITEPKVIKKPKIENNYNDYTLLSSSDEVLGEYLIRVQTYKKN